MKLRGIDFGNILGASGVQGFFGEGYWFHKLLSSPERRRFERITFVSKTVTLNPHVGNMRLSQRFTPAGPFPLCIRAKPWRGAMLNAVGLSNPGISALLNDGRLQKRTEPFFISVTSLAESPERKCEEFEIIARSIRNHKKYFRAPFGVQINLSCPNTGENPQIMIEYSACALNAMRFADVPLMPKYSIASAPVEAILELERHPYCDAICTSNTIPFGWEGVDWNTVWGSTTSPLAGLGGGGLSGEPLRRLVCRWIKELRSAGFTKPINGGGGILSERDVVRYYRAGASSVFFGTLAAFASFFPWKWKIGPVVHRANNLRWR